MGKIASSRATGIRVELLTSLVAFAAYSTVFGLSKSLIMDNSDFRFFLMSSLHSRDAAQWFPGATADFQRSLGLSEYPVGLIFDLPWLIATSVPVAYLQVSFAATTCFSLYTAVNLLGYRLKVPQFQRQTAGFLLPLLMFVPGPVKWNSVAIYTASFGWTVSVLTIVLVACSLAPRWRIGMLVPFGIIAGMYVFWANISYLPMTLPAFLLGIAFLIWKSPTKFFRRRIVLIATVILGCAVLTFPIFIGTYLFGVWSIPEVAVQDNIDKLSNWLDAAEFFLLFPGLSKVPGLTTVVEPIFVRIVTMTVLVLSIVVAWRRSHRNLAFVCALALGLVEIYVLVYSFTAIYFSREIGLTPSYIEIVGYPAWILAIVALLLDSKHALQSTSKRVRQFLPVALMLVWVFQWTVRNHSLRSEIAQFPIRQTEITHQISELVDRDLRSGEFTRVIILQNQYSDERAAEGFRIRRANDFSYSYLLQLQAKSVPVLNAYSHLISPRAFKSTNQFFGDGRPSWRQFSLYDFPNIGRLEDFSIRYVLSEFKILDARLRLIFQEPFVAYGLFPTAQTAYLYEVVQPRVQSQVIDTIAFQNDSIQISGYSEGNSTVSIPIEFSRCLTLNAEDESDIPTINPGPLGLVQLRFQGALRVRLRYENSIFQWRNCRIRDYLDYRNE